MKTLPATSVDESQLAELDKARSALPPGSPLGETLDYLLDTVRCGHSVTLVTDETPLSPSQAAKILGMSRTHLYKLLDAGTVRSVHVGRDRRITLGALREYQTTLDRDNADLAMRFAHRDANRNALLQQIAAATT
ncbi:hypothetical protein NJB1507_04950 [Mycobacterium marinum]|uniref:helix-turn-helix domain-containing protein n=1 Tax=Mycobacterium marinum TaxID=1781 RepID=UPI0021C29E26|nr:excisionase family DNA-binding protein [Mycobacterium marinum]GJO16685.1 hypothetical protein NJB1507_04950 [Mycobacterium marinum]